MLSSVIKFFKLIIKTYLQYRTLMEAQTCIRHSLQIGYYSLRGKAQVLRLLAEFVGLPYHNNFFDPQSWSNYKEEQAQNWLVKDLPYVKNGEFVVTGTHAMLRYVIQLAGRKDLLGSSEKQRHIIDTFMTKDCLGTILGYICKVKAKTKYHSEAIHEQLVQIDLKNIFQMLEKYEENCPCQSFYVGELTVVDFIVYETMGCFHRVFQKQCAKFPKLMRLRTTVGEIPCIKIYEQKVKNVLMECPIEYFDKFREQSRRREGFNQETNSGDDDEQEEYGEN